MKLSKMPTFTYYRAKNVIKKKAIIFNITHNTHMYI